MSVSRKYGFILLLAIASWFVLAKAVGTDLQEERAGGESLVGAGGVGLGSTPEELSIRERLDLVSNDRVQASLVTLQGRVWYGNSPYPNSQVRIKLVREDAVGTEQIVFATNTETDGRFSLDVPLRGFGFVSGKMQVSVMPADSGDVAQSIPFNHASSELTGHINLGDIVFGRKPLLVAGQVVGIGGKPIAGLPLKIEYRMGADAEGRVSVNGTFPGDFASDQDGNFEVYAAIDNEASCRVSARSSFYAASQGTHFTPGQTGIMLVLDQSHMSVQGRVLVDYPSLRSLIGIRMVGPAIDGRTVNYGAGLADDGRFELRGLPVSDYVVVVEQRGALSGVLYSTDLNSIPESEGQESNSLNDIDLRGMLRLIEVQCTNDSGAQLFEAKLSRLSNSAERGSVESNIAGGKSLIILIGSMLSQSYKFSCSGYVSRSVSHLMQDTVVTLLREDLVRFVSPLASLVSDPYFIKFELYEEPMERLSRPIFSSVADEAGFASFQVDPEKGYRVQQVLCLKTADGIYEGRMLGESRRTGLLSFRGDQAGETIVAMEGEVEFQNALKEIGLLNGSDR